MALITVRDLTIGFRGPPLLESVSCQIEPGQRIALLGRNGAGKTTLLRILSGQVEPDAGQVALAPGVRVAMLPQDVPRELLGPVRDIVATGLTTSRDDPETAWQAERQLDRILTEMQLPAKAPFETLSSGMKRRVSMARALVSSPEVLLLDEPTNHLDVDAITWLEEFLGRTSATLIFVTHDRMFLRRLATRILEIDRGRLFDWSCDYDTFLVRKEDLLAAEEKQNALFDKKLAEEEVWIRQGIKARRTRNEGRVRALEAMRRERSRRRTSSSTVRMAIQEAERSGTLVAELEDVSFNYGDRTIIRDFSTLILRGDKVGIFGPNGAGKTTLLRLLLGRLQPSSGSGRLGTNLQIAYFDQLREQLDAEKSVQDNVGDGYDTVTMGGKRRHIIGYLEEFLFSPDRSRTLVRFLSGGECNRVLLAKLFAKPANLIVLDEPTNDLDAETLEMLEERLVQFQGTVLVVSHDRAFLDNVVASTIVFEGDTVKEYVGGYSDWLRQRAATQADAEPRRPTAAAKPSVAPAEKPPSAPARRKRSFKEQQELLSLPKAIERLEADLSGLHQEMAQADFYRKPGEEIARSQAQLKQWEADLKDAYERWEALEGQGD
jgi:ABC transport system ATP-binding/permease protein